MGELGMLATPPTPPHPPSIPTHLREVSLFSCDFRREREQLYFPKCQTVGSFKQTWKFGSFWLTPLWDFNKVLSADVTQMGMKLTKLSGDWRNHGILSDLRDCFKVGLSSQSHCCRGRTRHRVYMFRPYESSGLVLQLCPQCEEDLNCVYLWRISHSSSRNWPGSSSPGWADPSQSGTKSRV